MALTERGQDDAMLTHEDEVGGKCDGRGQCAIGKLDAGRAGGKHKHEGVV